MGPQRSDMLQGLACLRATKQIDIVADTTTYHWNCGKWWARGTSGGYWDAGTSSEFAAAV